MGKKVQTFELITNLAMFYTRCYMLAHSNTYCLDKDCALAYNYLIILRFNAKYKELNKRLAKQYA